MAIDANGKYVNEVTVVHSTEFVPVKMPEFQEQYTERENRWAINPEVSKPAICYDVVDGVIQIDNPKPLEGR